MGAFKIRGAYNMISQLPKEELERGVITYSSGNHGQAVAMAAAAARRARGDRDADHRPESEGRRLQVVRRRSDHGRHHVAGSTVARGTGVARTRAHDRAAVRSPADHHRPGNRRPRDSRAVSRCRHRVRACGRRRARVRNGGRDQATETIGAHRRGRAAGRAEDDEVARSGAAGDVAFVGEHRRRVDEPAGPATSPSRTFRSSSTRS